jgi:hypothetical protein
MSLAAAASAIHQVAAAKAGSTAAFRATVTSVAGAPLVCIRREGETTGSAESYAVITPFTLAVNDVVLCLPMGDKPVILGIIQTTLPVDADIVAPVLINANSPQTYANGTTTNPAGSPDASTASTSTYKTAFADTWTLPAGTWTIKGLATCSFIHSASGAVDFYGDINSTGALTRTVAAISSTVYTRWDDHVSATGIVSDGSTPLTVSLFYRSNTAGTTTPQAPKLFLVATRTA